MAIRYPVLALASEFLMQAPPHIQGEFDAYARARGTSAWTPERVVDIISAPIWTSTVLTWGAAGAPTVAQTLFTQTAAAVGLARTNMRVSGQIPNDARFTCEAWTAFARRRESPATATDPAVASVIAAVLNASAIRLTLGDGFPFDLGPIPAALAGMASVSGVSGAVVANGLPIAPAGSRVPIPIPWDIQPGVTITGILAVDTDIVPPGSDELDGLSVEVVLELFGTYRRIQVG